MRNLWATNGGLYLGFGCETPMSVLAESPFKCPLDCPLRYVGDRHIVTVGPNGSGKTTRLLLVNLIELKLWSMLVIDPKGELAAATAAHRAKYGKVILLNPFDLLVMGSHGFNPVAALDPNDPDFPDNAMGLAEALIRVEGKDPHWGQSARELVCALIMYVRLVFKNPSLEQVRSLLALSSAAFQKLVVTREFEHEGEVVPGIIRASIFKDCSELEVKAKRFVDVGPENKEMLAIFSTALTQTGWLDSRQVKPDLSKGSIDFSIMKREPTTIYLILPANRLGSHSSWLRLMITAVLQPLMRDTFEAKVPVLLMLDEFAQLGHLPIIERTMALMRGYGVKLWSVVQDLSQLNDIYRTRWESFLGNSGILNSFAPQDVFTSEYLSKLTGMVTVTPLSGGTGHDAELNMSQVARPLMLPQEIRDMPDGMSLVFSHKLKGTVATAFVPRPDVLPHVKPYFENFFGNMKRPDDDG